MQLRDEQDKLLAEWTKASDAAVKLAAKTPTVEKALIQADAAFKDARAAMWAYFVRGGERAAAALAQIDRRCGEHAARRRRARVGARPLRADRHAADARRRATRK